jgi:hypothetical protein
MRAHPLRGLGDVVIRTRRLAGIVLATFAFVRCAGGSETEPTGLGSSDGGGDGQVAEGGRVDDAEADVECTRRVVINEVMVGGATAGEEFIELFNAGTCAAAIGSWSLRYRSATDVAGPTLVTFDPGTGISARSVLLVASATFDGGAADYEFTAGLAATGGQIGLLDGEDAVIDAVGYGSATGAYVEKAAAAAPAANGAIARKSGGQDTNDNAADFVARATHSAGAPNP